MPAPNGPVTTSGLPGPTHAMPHRTARRAIALTSVCLVLVACSGDDDDRTATELGDEGVGICLDVGDDVGAEIVDLPVVPCDEPHTHEIYAVVESTADPYPGFDALEDEAQVVCLEAFEPYVGISPFDSTLFYSWMVPTLASWEDPDLGERGDREIVCVLGDRGGEPLTGSMRDTRR